MSKEYVTKEKVIETILSYGIGWGSARVRGVINNIPAADVVEVRHGRWIPEYGSMDRVDYWHCSVCDSDFQYIGVTSLYDYCPNCGAKMDGGQDE